MYLSQWVGRNRFNCSVHHRVGRVLSFFSNRRSWGSPNHSTAGECAPPPGSGGRGTLAGERGVGRVPIPTRGQSGHTLWYSLYILYRTYFVVYTLTPSQLYFPPSNHLPSRFNKLMHAQSHTQIIGKSLLVHCLPVHFPPSESVREQGLKP